VLQLIKELSAHMFWADGIVWNAAIRIPEKANHLKLKELLHHIHEVQNAYLTFG
jgi:hypothetical protein